MFGKLVTEVCQNSRGVPLPQKQAKVSESRRNYTDMVDWRSWVRKVREFYKKTQSPSNSSLSPVFISKINDNRPYVQVNVYGSKLTALLDSGANVSVIAADYLDTVLKFKPKKLVSDIRNIKVADGNTCEIIGLLNLPICFGSLRHTVKVYVVPTISTSFILGSDFCNLFRIKIDYGSEQIEIPKNTIAENNVGNCLSISLDHLDSVQQPQAKAIIDKFQDLSGKNGLGRTNKIEMFIDTGDSRPFKQKQYPLSPHLSKILNDEIDDMLNLKVIEPSNSPWSSPLMMVKKSSGEYRVCFDGRKLNSITKHDAYPLPRIDSILNNLRDAKYISSIDLKKAFWQVPLDVSSREKTAFPVAGRGLFQFTVMPFGLCNSAQMQQRLVDSLFGPEFENNIFTYLDDTIIVSNDFDEHIKLLNIVFDKLKEANLTVNYNKCEFFKTSLKYLGYIVDVNGLHVDPEKVSCMVNYPRPTTTTEIKRFVGMCGWYRRFINNFSTLMAPINDLLKGKKKENQLSGMRRRRVRLIPLKIL